MGIKVIRAVPNEVRKIHSLIMRQINVYRISAQQGSFLYTRYGTPFGPGDDLFGLFFNISRKFFFEGIRELKSVFGSWGLLSPVGGACFFVLFFVLGPFVVRGAGEWEGAQ